MGRGGVKTFDGLVDAVGDNSPVDGDARAAIGPRSGLSRSVPLRDLVANPHNPRDSVGDLEELASIAEFQLQPAVVVTRSAFERLYPETKVSARWVVVIGNRRLAAAHKFGRPELDVVVKDELAKDRATLLTAVIAENVDRSGFDVIEEAKAVESLVQEYGSADAAADHLRKSKTWVSQRRALLRLAPALQEATRKGDLAIREARTLARVPLEQQVARWTTVCERNGSDRAARREAAESSADTVDGGEVASRASRSVGRALRKFDTAPNELAVALRDQLGDAGARTLVNQLRKLLKQS
ncbi:ParB N-terminal domain-containing protein [Mycobacterium sp. TY815]|uniref:ParB/RepB/Spo0J family partition protein n=1 Tax=Mycobacterium sp. TY815 TaxID=3050581 RepID=UPI002741F67F|nr:ParB N-terminal domain-containing protein [Mycobacterium sp. TY815]MDP7707404.1 ParB N-terminal domain-containing protein [Mycobacterium sp. TY815]